jgi:4-amino-4-deoxy-L-arabinose transferase-like glycosyltransferase
MATSFKFRGEKTNRRTRRITIMLPLLLIVIFGFYLRCESVMNTEVIRPLRADAGQYFMYAYNLRHKHTYSYQVGAPDDLESPVKPDAVRAPGYPLFLSLFIDGLPNRKMFGFILFSQVVISTLTILFSFLLFEKILSSLWALGIALLVASSPHLIVSSGYILSETLFCFLLVVSGWLMSLFGRRPSIWLGFAVGLAMGASSLVRPSLQFFPLFLAAFLIFHYGWKKGKRYSGIILAGFALAFLPWIARNMMTLNAAGDNRLVTNFLHHGMYPGFMYRGDPQTHGFPYRYDPDAQEIGKNPASVLKEISHRFMQSPMRHMKWYFVDKPVTLWSWDMIQGAGDAFIYPVSNSPYFHRALFRITHRLMLVLHYPMLLLALLGCVLAWFPLKIPCWPQHAVFLARFCSLLLIYYTLIHMIGAPFPRYSVPLRPYLYGMALFTLCIIIRSIKYQKSLTLFRKRDR